MEALQDKQGNADAGAAATGSEASLYRARRDLLFRDGVTFVVLTVAAVVLYACTSFMFRSFDERRNDLARDFTQRGKAALAADQPEAAVAAFRTALSYAPDDRTNHLLLAEALAQGHHTDEATSYFLSLRESQPANGFINLQLAHLAREKGDRDSAIEYYRAASLGTWNGDGIGARRAVQVELADFLARGGDLVAARAELLLAAADTPESTSIDLLFGDKLQQAQDPGDALIFYRKAVQLDPHNVAALTRAGRLLYRTGQFAEAHQMLERAWKQEPKTVQDRAEATAVKVLADDADRIQDLTLGRDLPPQTFTQHLRTDAPIARARLNTCLARGGPGAVVPPAWQTLATEWQVYGKHLDRATMPQSAADQDNLRQLILQTETETAANCGAPAGDDALLLQLAHTYVAQ